jgi:hypothetical protein
MSRREKIIVSIMLIVIIFGGTKLLLTSYHGEKIGNTPIKGVKALKKFVYDVSKKIEKADSSRFYSYTIQKLKSKWINDPFLSDTSSALPLKNRNPSPSIKATTHQRFVYSGYLAFGGRKIAIINGMEYEAGETLASDRFILHDISPRHVVIAIAGENETIRVPIEENQ